MKQIRKRITYANVMSSIAVFLVLGGATAFAAKKIGSNQIKGNAITTGKIKKEAVTSTKIKKNAITTAKIKNGAVSGAKVNVSTLGTVPSASTANSLAGRTPFSFFMGAGTRNIVTIGPFTVQAKCTLGVEDEAELLLFTSVDNAAMDDNSGDEFVPFNVSDNPAFLVGESDPSGGADIESDEGELIAVAPDGTTIATENHGAGVNVAGHVGECFFAGTIVKLS